MKLAWAFFRRDAEIALSYRLAFVAQFAGNVMLLAVIYFVGKTVGAQSLPALQRYGGSFLAFWLIGIALTDCVSVSLASFAAQVREAQTTGTLEVTLMSPVRLAVILVYSSLWNYFLSAIRFVLYLVVGSAMYGIDLGRANLFAALLIFILTVMCFMGIGILWAGIVLIIKRGEAIIMMGGVIITLLGGVLFPVSLLPPWVQTLTNFVPLTHALEGMRLAVLQGYGLRQLGPTLMTLSIFAAVLLVAGISGFNIAVEAGRRTGSLTQY
ncbi:MAG: ABC transporter permease [Acidobacteria bacterium]|nr:ABC transporter permease [Acidobacteriota bacterium]